MTVSPASEHEAISGLPGFQQMLDMEVADFQQRYQRYLLILISVLVWLAALRYALTSHSSALSPPNLPPLVALVTALTLGYLLRQKTALSVALYLAGLALAVTLEAFGHPGSPALFLYAPLMVLISGVASSFVLLVAGLACGVALMTLTLGMLNSADALMAPGLSLFCVSMCAWIASRPIFDSLSMALYSAQDSIRVRDELREQRHQLAQSVKALDEALYRLNRLNASLIIARQQAEEARQLKVRFANMISHEIRTPLNIIISFSEVIVNAPESYGISHWPANLRDDVNEIYRSGKHLLGLINDVLDLAQIEANRVVLKKEYTSLLDVVDQAVSLAGKWFDHAGLYLKVDVVGEIPELQLDRIRIRQVILNLLSNARHYTVTGGVTVRVERTVEEITVSVKDTGLGISPDNLQHLFDEFQKVGETVDHTTGSGLGLSISRMFIQLHGGRMWADSAGVAGQGTTVAFSLPLPSANVASELPSTPHDAEFWQSRYDQARGERVILVAADDSSVLQVGSRLLNNQGKIVTSSLSGLGQVAPLQQPDVITVFVNSEGTDDSTMLPAPLRGFNVPQDVPLILCHLASPLPATNQSTLEAQDVNAWLLKPVTRDELAATIYSLAPHAKVVLTVEDDLTMARFYELSLASDKRFFNMPSFVNVARISEVLPVLNEHVPDIILLDLNLADGSGWDVLAQVRARWSREQLPVVVVTAMDRYGAPVLRARELQVKRAEGFSQRQTVLCLQNMIDAVLG